MKKAFIALLTLLLCFSLFACKPKGDQGDPAQNNPGASSAPNLGGGSIETPIIEVPLN